MSKRSLAFGACLLAALLGLAFSAPATIAWGNGGYSSNPEFPDYGIHDWIADKALAFQTADVSFLLTTYHSDFLIGTEAPDNGEYVGDSYNHHVYYRSSGALQADVGALRAREMYKSALDCLKASDYEHAAYYTGAMAHYISDVGVYSHTMGASTDWGTSTSHAAYEDHVHTLLGSLTAPQTTALVWNDAYNVTISLAHKTTFGAGPIKPNTWMENNYNWNDPAFKSSCLESLNESVRAVASAFGLLTAQAGLTSVPEFEMGICLVLALTVALFSSFKVRRSS